MAIDLSTFHRTFFEESFEGLAVMESGLLALESGQPDSDAINAIFRAAHSIKGGAGTFGFSTVARFTHAIETLLDQMRNGDRAADRAIVDLLLRGVDALGTLLRASQQGAPADLELVAPVHEALEAAVAKREPAAPNAFDIFFAPKPDIFRSGNDPYRILRELRDLGGYRVEPDLSQLPSFDALDPERSYLRWRVTVSGPELSAPQVDEVFAWVEDQCELSILPSSESRASSPASESPAGPLTGRRMTDTPSAVAAPASVSGPALDSSSIRVNTEKIDALINLVGELVITQSMLSALGQDFDMSRVEALKEGLAQLERNSRGLQEHVIGIRMVPIALVFNRFPRVVHDVSRQLGKQVQLRIRGEHTEVDKTVVEKITDPLVHLVRNSLDHGIEPAADRIARGKSPEGLVTLNAFHRGGEILIEVSDDGAGLDAKRIRQKAEARGLVAPDDVLSDERLYDLIFEPGFSTADTVSDLSGRGVGMDVVRRNIKALGGTIELRSAPGAGTTFTIRLPLTLAILDGQLLRIGEQTFVAPLVSIVETVRIRPELVGRMAGTIELYLLRDEYLPILRPHRLLDLEAEERAFEDSLLMIVEAEGRRAALLVDELTTQQQVVIKSLELNFRPVRGISGATILGDGSVALILDVAGLLALNRQTEQAAA